MTVLSAPLASAIEVEVRRADVRVAGVRVAAKRVRALVGRPLTAYVAGAASVNEFVTAVDHGRPASTSAYVPRLGLVLQLAETFRAANAVTLLRAWLREADPELKACPADLIRESADVFMPKQLQVSAESYLRR
jgi:hypothetical protein